jgi:ectoine hydroxylase-related dioxygenase (phytanoyl-CoA dioxygenase family)
MQVEFFKREGYLLMPGLLGHGQVELLQQLVADQLEHVRSGQRSKWDLLEDKSHMGQTEVHRLSRIMARHPEFERVARSTRVIEVISDIFGREPLLCVNRHNMVMVKAPRVGQQVDWHQDGYAWNHPNMISLMIYLDNANTENGCLEVVPGTHNQGIFPVDPVSKHYMDLQDDKVAGLTSQALPIIARPGDGLLFHSCLPHFSRANCSDHGRRTLVFAYVACHEAHIMSKDMEAIECVSLAVSTH